MHSFAASILLQIIEEYAIDNRIIHKIICIHDEQLSYNDIMYLPKKETHEP
ncbi:MAG: hypothetical protein IJY19_08530 [Ruminococcus sp.]|nr:hypothetical protein [Ruminococcus sp.]